MTYFISKVRQFGALALLFFICGAALPQNQALSKVEMPAIKTGDSWTYHKVDGYTGIKGSPYVNVVTSVSEQEIRVQSNGTRTVFDKNFNRLVIEQGAAKNIADPFYPMYSFPLEVGKSWEQKVTFTATAVSNHRRVVTLTGKVLGWEQVTVPAGTFNALKIDVRGPYNHETFTTRQWWFGGWQTDTLWYVPEVKNVVKRTYVDLISNSGPWANDVYELLEYKVSQNSGP